MLPDPAPTSHSSSPGRGASAASVTRPHRLFGDLPVVGERVVGQHLRDPLIGQVPHGDHVQVVDIGGRTGRPLAGGGVAATLGRPAELLEHA